MNNKISVRECSVYNSDEVLKHIAEIYESCDGPDVSGKKVLIKPNILTDSDPAKCICTHPVVVKAMVLYLMSKGAIVFAGDSPAVHFKGFTGQKSGIRQVCDETGAIWVDFMSENDERRIGNGKVKVASIVNEVDLIISLPKFKNHELVYFTGAIKNTLGLVPGFSKARLHAIHQDRNKFGEFLVDLNEAITPDFFLMDAISGMEGPGPGKGTPVHLGLLIGSTNPLAVDIIASRIAGYDPMIIPTSKTALFRKKWLSKIEDIDYSGPEFSTILKADFRKIPVSPTNNISLQFVIKRIPFLKKLERRPVFIQKNCSGCQKCVSICPVKAIKPGQNDKTHINLNDRNCIRCFCCSEVCMDEAVEIRRKVFGV